MIAYGNPGIHVNVVNVDKACITAWNSASLPLCEPNLDRIISIIRDGVPANTGYLHLFDDIFLDGKARPLSDQNNLRNNEASKHPMARAPNLKFSVDVEAAVAGADLIFLVVHTPTKLEDVGKDLAPDLTHLKKAATTIAKVATTDKIGVEKSTVPCRTADLLRRIVSTLAINMLDNAYFCTI